MYKIGALTSKVSAFRGRPWEIKYLAGYDVGDNLCCPVVIDLKGRNVLRVGPTFNPDLNLEWVSDKSRYIYESYKSRNRFTWPIFRVDPTKKQYKKIFYSEYSKILLKAWSAKANFISLVCHDGLDLKTLILFKEGCRKVGADFVSENKKYLSKTFNRDYSSTKNLNDLGKIESCTFIGVNPRAEAAIANLIFRLRYLIGNFKSFFIGKPIESNFSARNYGSSYKAFEKSLGGIHGENLETYARKTKLLTYGEGLTSRLDANSWKKAYESLLGIPSYFIRLNSQVNSVALDYLGYDEWSDFSNSILLCPQEKKSYALAVATGSCAIFTTHLSSHMREADLLVPMSSYLEKENAYLDYIGKYKISSKVITPMFNTFNTPKEILEQDLNTYGVFGFWKKTSPLRDLKSLKSSWDFQKIKAYKGLGLKLIKSAIKTYSGNTYTNNSVLKISPTLLQIKNLQEKQHFSFI